MASRHSPRSFLLRPKLFGKTGVRVEWHPRPTAVPQIDWFLASALQHRFVIDIRAAIKTSDKYTTVPDFTTKVGVKYRTFNGMLNGSSVMSLEDIAMARRLLGIDLNVWGAPGATP